MRAFYVDYAVGEPLQYTDKSTRAVVMWTARKVRRIAAGSVQWPEHKRIDFTIAVVTAQPAFGVVLATRGAVPAYWIAVLKSDEPLVTENRISESVKHILLRVINMRGPAFNFTYEGPPLREVAKRKPKPKPVVSPENDTQAHRRLRAWFVKRDHKLAHIKRLDAEVKSVARRRGAAVAALRRIENGCKKAQKRVDGLTTKDPRGMPAVDFAARMALRRAQQAGV